MFSEEEDSNEINLFQFNDDTPIKKEERMKKLKSTFSKINNERSKIKQKTTKVDSSKMMNLINSEVKNKINNVKRHSVDFSLLNYERKIPLNFKNNKKLVNEVINIIKNGTKNQEERKIFDEFILQLQPFIQVLNESNHEEQERILRHLNANLKYEFIPENTLICNYGELIDKFYLILRGEVDVIVPNEEEVQLSEEEYFLYLLRLKIFNENKLINKIISQNSKVYIIEEKNFDDWIRGAYKILVMSRLNYNSKRKSIINRSPNPNRKSIQRQSIKNLLSPEKNQVNQNTEHMLSDYEKTNMIIKLRNEILCSMKILEPYNPDFAEVDISKYRKERISTEEYIERYKPIKFEYSHSFVYKKNVKIISYFLANSLNKGNKFGDMMSDMNQNNVQTEYVSTIISKEDCDFGTLDRASYIKSLKEVSERMRKKKLNYLLDLNFFKGCNKNLFMNSFCNLFEKKIISNNEVLFNENDNASNMKVYIIKKGEIELNCNKSIYDINNIFIGLNFKDLVDPEDEDEILNKETDEYIKFKKKKNHIKIQYLKGNDIIGLNDSVFNGKYLYTAKCTSSTCSLYEIHMNFLKLLLHSDPKIYDAFTKIEMVQRNLFIKLLLKQRINRKDFFDYKSKAMSGVSFGCIKFNGLNNRNNSLKQLLEEKEMKKNNLSFKKVSRHKAKIRILIDKTYKIFNENPKLFENTPSKKYKKNSSRNTITTSALIKGFTTNSDLTKDLNYNQFKTICCPDEELPKIKDSKITSNANTYYSSNSKYSNSNNQKSHFRDINKENRKNCKIRSQDFESKKNIKLFNKINIFSQKRLITSSTKRKQTKAILKNFPNFYFDNLNDKKFTIFNMTNKSIYKKVLKFD